MLMGELLAMSDGFGEDSTRVYNPGCLEFAENQRKTQGHFKLEVLRIN